MVLSLTELAFTLILDVMTTLGLPGLFALMAVESFGIPPLPSEVILPFAGILIAQQATGFSWPTVVVVAVAGGLAGALIAYEVGRRGGQALIRRAGRRIGVGAEDLDRAHAFFERRGPITVFLSRLVPIIRAYISYPAGAAEMDRVRFSLYTVLGATPFTVALVYAGYYLGQPSRLGVIQKEFQVFDVLAVIAGAALVVWLLVRRRRRRRAEAAAAPPSDSEG